MFIEGVFDVVVGAINPYISKSSLTSGGCWKVSVFSLGPEFIEDVMALYENNESVLQI